MPLRPASIAVLVAVALSAFVTGAAPVEPNPAGASAPSAPPTYLPTVSRPGDFVLPVPGEAVVLTAFRPPAVRWGAGHRGVDLAAAVESPIRASGAGTVVYAGVLAGRGVVSIQHSPTLRTTYEPVDPTVVAGDSVGAGTVIGALQEGHLSCSPASCLHWGARAGPADYLDPMLLLTGWRVRLLPWQGRSAA